MRLDHPDYIKLVMEAYNKKRANNELSPLLAQSTPAKIRRECLNVYQERYDKKDERMLRAFFGPAENGRQFLQSIRDFKTDRFKPLDKYLKGGSEKTDDTNLELLAWLIDFQYRPYVFGMEVTLNDNELFIIGKSVNSAGEKNTEPKAKLTDSKEEEEGLGTRMEDGKRSMPKEPEEDLVITKEKSENPSSVYPTDNSTKNLKKALIIFLSLVISFGGMYIIWQHERSRDVNAGCMYWADDHYEPVSCNEERKGRLILPLNAARMKSFKRITREDTITERSIGKVYYIRKNNTVEYYTEAGNHPIEVTRSLKELSAYMFQKHLRKQQAADQDLLSEENPKFINNR
jgi:hypothetical protein